MNPTISQTKDSHVYEQLKSSILRNEFRPGERLREEELCRALKITRTPLRAALRRLEQERLLVNEPYCGVHVRKIGSDEIGLLFDMREMLEGLAARNVAIAGHAAGLKKLHDLALHCDEAQAAQKWTQYFESDKAFHWELIEQSGNINLVEVMEVYNFQLRTFAFHDQYSLYIVEQLRKSLKKPVDQHQRLALVLAEGNANRAEAAFRRHIRGSKQTVEAALADWDAAQAPNAPTTIRKSKTLKKPVN